MSPRRSGWKATIELTLVRIEGSEPSLVVDDLHLSFQGDPEEAGRQALAEGQELGALPVWDLSDLYPSMDAPEVERDLGRAEHLGPRRPSRRAASRTRRVAPGPSPTSTRGTAVASRARSSGSSSRSSSRLAGGSRSR